MRCLRCKANVTNLSLIPVIEKHRDSSRVQITWEMSTFGATLAYLRRTTPRVICSEYFPGRPSGELINDIRNEDVQSQSFADDSLDLITSNQVFEHVEDDIRGYGECFRILQPGGALIFSVPLYDIPETRQMASRTQHGIEHYGTPEYHDSRSGGAGSELCFWRHRQRTGIRSADAGRILRGGSSRTSSKAPLEAR